MRVTRKSGWGGRTAAVAVGVAAVVLMTGTGHIRAQATGVTGASAVGDSYDADLTLQYRYVDDSGHEVRTRPPGLAFHLTRRRHRGGWQTSMTLQGIDRPVVQTSAGPRELDNPFLVSRVEYDEDGTAPRLFNRSGQELDDPAARARARMALPADLEARAWGAANQNLIANAPQQRFAEHDALPGLVSDATDHAGRQRALDRQFGHVVGRVRGLDQYRFDNGDRMQEVLVNPTTAVPVELNTTRGGRLVDHALFTYDTLPNGLLVRHHVHAEHLLDDGSSTRSVADLEFTNVRLGAGRPQ